MRQLTFIEDPIYGTEEVRLALNFGRALRAHERLAGARLVRAALQRPGRVAPGAEAPGFFTIRAGSLRAEDATLSFVVSEVSHSGLWRLRFELRVASTPEDGAQADLVFLHDVLVWVLEASPYRPVPHVLRESDYRFLYWPRNALAGTYPASAHVVRGGGQDPPLTADPITLYTSAYNLTSGTRVEGLGTRGLGFLNTSQQGDLGGLLLALDTRGTSGPSVVWEAGTHAFGGRNYRMSVEWRVGASGAWTVLPEHYDAHPVSGDSQVLVSALPAACDDQELVQVRWRYHSVGTGGGQRPQLWLSNIHVTAAQRAGGFAGPGSGSMFGTLGAEQSEKEEA